MKAAIFDLDGTLADSIPLHFVAIKHALKKYGVDVKYRDWQPYVGFLTTEFIDDLNKSRKLNIDKDKFKIDKREYLNSLYKKKVKLFPGTKYLLRALKKNRIKMAVASSEWKKNVSFFLKLQGVDNYFDAILAKEDIKKHKPDPGVFLKAARLISVQPSECVVFEDSKAGLEAAARAGMKSIAVSTTFPRKELKADLVVSSLKEREKILKFIL